MGRGGHGPGMAGGSHGHGDNPEEVAYNLYQHLDPERTTALNATVPGDAIGVFKPHARRLEAEPRLLSDADEELLVIASFTSPVHIRRIVIIGSGPEGHHPSYVRCVVNDENIDFTSVGDATAAQEFELPVNPQGEVELTTVLSSFTNVMVLALHFTRNHGDVENTAIQYIGLQGDHTHFRREAVDAEYEVLCTGEDHAIEEAAGIAPHDHSHSHSHGHSHGHAN
mmetsp:Transcript_9989/g.33955  ORF Transcript_9989/g.33955 Transcript_9989/m.33955 type:complete len:225 (-) Transcript_9989:46-720(-)